MAETTVCDECLTWHAVEHISAFTDHCSAQQSYAAWLDNCVSCLPLPLQARYALLAAELQLRSRSLSPPRRCQSAGHPCHAAVQSRRHRLVTQIGLAASAHSTARFLAPAHAPAHRPAAEAPSTGSTLAVDPAAAAICTTPGCKDNGAAGQPTCESSQLLSAPHPGSACDSAKREVARPAEPGPASPHHSKAQQATSHGDTAQHMPAARAASPSLCSPRSNLDAHASGGGKVAAEGPALIAGCAATPAELPEAASAQVVAAKGALAPTALHHNTGPQHGHAAPDIDMPSCHGGELAMHAPAEQLHERTDAAQLAAAQGSEAWCESTSSHRVLRLGPRAGQAAAEVAAAAVVQPAELAAISDEQPAGATLPLEWQVSTGGCSSTAAVPVPEPGKPYDMDHSHDDIAAVGNLPKEAGIAVPQRWLQDAGRCCTPTGGSTLQVVCTELPAVGGNASSLPAWQTAAAVAAAGECGSFDSSGLPTAQCDCFSEAGYATAAEEGKASTARLSAQRRTDTPLQHIAARHRQAEEAARDEVRRALLSTGSSGTSLMWQGR
jgi:hypothetical protein